MLLRDSHNDKEILKKINDLVGKPFTLSQRIKLRGVGSPKLYINSSSIDIRNLLIVDNSLNSCNIEMRPNGIIVRFRSRLETYALAIPYYKLNIYKGKSEEYSIYKDHYFVKVKANTTPIHKFIKKIMDYKIEQSPTQIHNL